MKREGTRQETEGPKELQGVCRVRSRTESENEQGKGPYNKNQK